MTKLTWLCISLALASNVTWAAEAEAPDTHSKQVYLTSGQLALASMGSLEPMSIGSYALRMYKPLDVEFPYDNFLVGLVRSRDGVLDSVTLADINGDGQDEVIVIMSSAGSGNYFAADAIEFNAGKLNCIASVDFVDGNAALLSTLRQAYQQNSISSK